jgi:hypothetical protein
MSTTTAQAVWQAAGEQFIFIASPQEGDIQRQLPGAIIIA